MTLAQLVIEHPHAAARLKALGVDYWCNGDRTVEQACEQQGLDAQQVLSDVTALAPDPSTVHWETASLQALIDHILAEYHRPLWKLMPVLEDLLGACTAASVFSAAAITELTNVLHEYCDDAKDHMLKEERVLFPALLGGHAIMAGRPLDVMKREHQRSDHLLRRAQTVVATVHPHDAKDVTWQSLKTQLESLYDSSVLHMHLENNILFPKVRTQFGL